MDYGSHWRSCSWKCLLYLLTTYTVKATDNDQITYTVCTRSYAHLLMELVSLKACMHLFFPTKEFNCLQFECPRSVAEDHLNVGCFCWCWKKKSNFPFFCIACHLVSFYSREKWAAIVTVSVIGVFLKLDIFSSNGTCQMHYEQLAYQTITVMVCCLLWFQHASQDSASWYRYLSVCGLTNFTQWRAELITDHFS